MARDEQDTDEVEPEATTPVIGGGPMLGTGGELRDGRYVLDRRIGYGGMAAVWLASDERLGRSVAVKVLSDTLAHDQEYLERFRREARVAARLTHPNLVGIYDYEAEERPFLVMEYIEGGNLAERIEAGDVPDTEQLARELLAALRHIHAAGVLHRDVKPQNVLIDRDGRARLTDFGIAQPHDATSLTGTGQVIGTESYLAPEVMAGEPASERSDLYALGVVLDKAATAAGASAALAELIDQLRAELSEDRPGSASQALAALDRGGDAVEPTEPTERFATAPTTPLREPTPVGAEPTPPGVPPTWTDRSGQIPAPEGGRGRRALGVLAIAALLAALLVGLAIGTGDDEPARDGQQAASEQGGGGGGGSQGETETAPAETTETTETTAPEETTPEETAPASTGDDPYALNDQGFALNNEGRYEEAVPILEQAVEGLRDSGDEQTYNYALYNLGVALVGAGRPDEAIPILEERLAYPDQTETVQAKLDEAYAAAGVEPKKAPKPPKEEED